MSTIRVFWGFMGLGFEQGGTCWSLSPGMKLLWCGWTRQ